MVEYEMIGEINVSLLEDTFGPISTSELIITNERIEHIREEHPMDLDFFYQYGAEAAIDPDWIFLDNKRAETISMLKKLDGTNLNIVVKLALGSDEKHPKHSVITSYRMRRRGIKSLERKNSLLYKKPDFSYNEST